MRGDRPHEPSMTQAQAKFTPHARGSTGEMPLEVYAHWVYPACAGIDLGALYLAWESDCLPRMRGDRPDWYWLVYAPRQFTPHARGSTRPSLCFLKPAAVYPACAGIDLLAGAPMSVLRGLPRMRGDRPALKSPSAMRSLFTPHARGSTLLSPVQSRCLQVYPACAGIDPLDIFCFIQIIGLPRMRGDRPAIEALAIALVGFTPHARGSTVKNALITAFMAVYPACAGIDPYFPHQLHSTKCLPRMRGDRPYICTACKKPIKFTPHARGSTIADSYAAAAPIVYPACAGIDPGFTVSKKDGFGLPRMRGDRPCHRFYLVLDYRFTPHARGSTVSGWRGCVTRRVYPACAGIDLRNQRARLTQACLPRMRGDRPRTIKAAEELLKFTPHARGSTEGPLTRLDAVGVYPACAGIDPIRAQGYIIRVGLPRMRGDRPRPERAWWLPARFTPHARGSTA